MLKQSPGWAVATLLAIFVAGGLVGWGIGMRTGHRGVGGPRWGRGREGGGPGAPGGGVHSFLKRELDLTPAQEDSVRAIFARHRPQMEALWRQMRPRFDSVRAAIDSEISGQLTPAQRTKFQELERRMEERLRREPKPDSP
ncbi:MAG TPA: periplasmic heavy metal sensor [Gemmatimonadales bacterium]|nr:periplasmic heavy metal sensor [Gemmatimonadales bacterium]